MHYAVARILDSAGELERLYTDICAVRGWPRLIARMPKSALPAALRRLAGRVPEGIDPRRITTFETVGLRSVLKAMADRSHKAETAIALEAGRAFSAAVVRRGFGRAGGFYGISGECLEQVEMARARGLWTAVEQIIAPRAMVDRLVAEQHARFPGWEEGLADDPLAADFAAREKAEWEAADLVICPSEFVRDGVIAEGGPADKCVVVPYGVQGRIQERRRSANPRRPVRVLTVGAVNLRKGAPTLLAVARELAGRAEFRLVGPLFVLPDRRTELAGALDLRGAVPRAEIEAHYAWADVFLLPSVCEGSATVTYEALAAGLPVITTANAGSVVSDGVDGFIVGPNEVSAITACIAALGRDRYLLREMSMQARCTASRHDLLGYGRRLSAALAPLRGPPPTGSRRH
ncbi:glycosyltransferase family 4 protein [Afifella sp. IM 167]|uniref:glycosyltransferase family 4 protein n=1 Tax=Afifella sp. IM 167 TaxID=2033586 RepID=UPI001CCE2A0C|nr:glycosyltransferase family 4 protein [Afifella sp. IM 167]MBZ8134437.1 glycoside hydrolase [Afifella sp. IM 167]